MTFLGFLLRLFSFGSLAVLALGAWSVWWWWDRTQAAGAFADVAPPPDWPLYAGLALLAVSGLGRFAALLLLGRGGEPSAASERGRVSRLKGADGAEIHVESFGPQDAPALILTHGWGLDSRVWRADRSRLIERHRVVVWDLPGLGRSTLGADEEASVERYADHLRVLIEAERGRPAVLVGHSIGGMIVQTLCLRHPDLPGRQVAGVVLENTTHRDPLTTAVLAPLWTALQKPLIEPSQRLTRAISPVVRLMNLQAYVSGFAHLAVRLGGFGTRPLRADLELVTRMVCTHSPKVQAKGNLAMMRWGVSEALPRMRVPALVFAGGRDLLTLPRAGEDIAAAWPGAELRRIAHAGHMGPRELADAYETTITEFADRVLLAEARGDAAPRADRPPEPSRDDEARGTERFRAPPAPPA